MISVLQMSCAQIGSNLGVNIELLYLHVNPAVLSSVSPA